VRRANETHNSTRPLGLLSVSTELCRAAWGLHDNVEFKGKVPHGEIESVYHDCNIYVQASCTSPSGDTEGIPATMTEAAACGRLVVSTDHVGLPEAVPAEAHPYIVLEGDSPGLVHSIMDLLSKPNEHQALSIAGRKLMEERFNLLVQRTKWEEMYAEIIEQMS